MTHNRTILEFLFLSLNFSHEWHAHEFFHPLRSKSWIEMSGKATRITISRKIFPKLLEYDMESGMTFALSFTSFSLGTSLFEKMILDPRCCSKKHFHVNIHVQQAIQFEIARRSLRGAANKIVAWQFYAEQCCFAIFISRYSFSKWP